MSYFTKEEMQCSCCGEYKIDSDFLSRLETARGYSKIPYVINSCCRCVKHNEVVGGKPDSSHLFTDIKETTAADIKTQTSRDRYWILDSLIMAGFHRIGIGKTFIHVDNDLTKDSDVIWLY